MKKIYKQQPDMSFTDVTFTSKAKNILLIIAILVILAMVFSFTFKEDSKQVIYINKYHTDTVQQLLVLKSGLTEITVDRNKNIPTFCNNPGSLRPTSIKEVNDLAIGVVQAPSGKFLYFANKEHGFKALEILLNKVYSNNTLQETMNRFAPSMENNTESYINKLCIYLKCSPFTKIKNLDIKKLMIKISEVEGFKI